MERSTHIWPISKHLKQLSGYSGLNDIQSSIFTYSTLNEDNLVQTSLVPAHLTMCRLCCRALIPLMDYHSVRGFKGQVSQLWDVTSVCCTYPTAVKRLHSAVLALAGGVRIRREGPAAAFCHVSIIQSDVWVICFSILKNLTYK